VDKDKFIVQSLVRRFLKKMEYLYPLVLEHESLRYTI